jgi:hypothetical protein
MHVCNTALRESTPLVTQTPPPPKALADLRARGRKARLFGAISGEPMHDLLAKLPAALGRRLVFFEDSSTELSFDEAWLLNLFDAVHRADHDRYCFAMRSRMSRANASALHFLVCKAARALDV